jgi:hypothetical protein
LGRVEPSRGTRAASRVVGVAVPLVFLAGVALAGWITVWAIFAWAAHDTAWIVACAGATLLTLALPVAFLLCYERWQVERGLYGSSPSTAVRTLNGACGLFAALLFLVASPVVLTSAYFAWTAWRDGLPVASGYFACVALATFAEPVAFLVLYDRWQTRNGLQHSSAARD